MVGGDEAGVCVCGGGVKGGGGGEEDTIPLFKTPFYRNLCFLASMNLV